MRDAAAKLLTFQSIAGSVFNEPLRLADDLAATGFGNIESDFCCAENVMPARVRAVVGRSDGQGAGGPDAGPSVIKDLYETGRTAEYQGLILKRAREQVGGAGAGSDQGLAGAYEALSDSTTTLHVEHLGQEHHLPFFPEVLDMLIEEVHAAYQKHSELAPLTDTAH